MKISIDTFTGTAPKLSAALLPNSAGQIATNVRLISGALKAVNAASLEATNVLGNAASIYMLGAPGAAAPLTWTTDVDVAASPVADTEYRIYYTGDSTPKKSSLVMAGTPTGGPTNWYHMGVPGPTTAPTAAVSGAGSVPAGTYTYVYTYVTQFGDSLLEESAPSPAVVNPVSVSGSQGVLVSGLANPPSTTNYNFKYRRLYRTTGTTFQLVAQTAFSSPVSSTPTTYTDTLSETAILGDSLLSTSQWAPPPADLVGVCALPSSVLVGFRNNEVWFSEPGYPHAWPPAYMQAFDTQIVGVRAFGNSVVIGTRSHPYVGSGVHPDSFTFQKLPLLEPCLAKRSMAGDDSGVIYASANGLVAVGTGVAGVVTADALSRESFADFSPETFTSCVFERRYYGFYSSEANGSGAFVFSRDDAAPVSRLGIAATAVFVDSATARMLYVDPNTDKLYRFDPPGTLPATYTWKSKLFQSSAPGSLGCFRIVGQELDAEESAYSQAVSTANASIIASNAAAFGSPNGIGSDLNAREINAVDVFGINGSTLQSLVPTVANTVGVTVWAAKTIVLQGDYTLNEVHRLPSGTRAFGYEIQVDGQREVRGIQMATSPKELADG